jgi:hypothetical protein
MLPAGRDSVSVQMRNMATTVVPKSLGPKGVQLQQGGTASSTESSSSLDKCQSRGNEPSGLSGRVLAFCRWFEPKSSMQAQIVFAQCSATDGLQISNFVFHFPLPRVGWFWFFSDSSASHHHSICSLVVAARTMAFDSMVRPVQLPIGLNHVLGETKISTDY